MVQPDAGPAAPTFDADVAVNRAVWTASNARYTDARASAAWQEPEISWGVWQVPEAQLKALPPSVAGLDVVELGCGTAYFSAWLARRGAHPVGVDPTPAQLATARRCQAELGSALPAGRGARRAGAPPGRLVRPRRLRVRGLHLGRSLPLDPGGGAPAAPRRAPRLPARLDPLRPLQPRTSGPVGEQLVRPQFGMYRFDWRADGDGIEFHLPHGDLLRLLRANGFEVLDLIEIQAPPGAEDHPFYSSVPAAWAKRWPSEEIWVARKLAPDAARG